MLQLPQPVKIVKKENNQAIFEIEPLYPGYGITIGNALRRVLLSSLEGAAVTQVKIKGVAHEFSTIPGVLEDVITILLNIKQLRFRLFGNEPQKATLKVKGEKEVTGTDFVLPPQVELVNKDCHLATLTSKSAELEMEIQIEKGIGYSPREERTKKKSEIGTIVIDASFTPIKRVTYRVEDMRVGERTDYNRLFLEVETDGTITPEEAFYQAAKILIEHFSIIIESIKVPEKKVIEEKPVEAGTKKKKKTTSRKSSKK